MKLRSSFVRRNRAALIVEFQRDETYISRFTWEGTLLFLRTLNWGNCGFRWRRGWFNNSGQGKSHSEKRNSLESFNGKFPVRNSLSLSRQRRQGVSLMRAGSSKLSAVSCKLQYAYNVPSKIWSLSKGGRFLLVLGRCPIHRRLNERPARINSFLLASFPVYDPRQLETTPRDFPPSNGNENYPNFIGFHIVQLLRVNAIFIGRSLFEKHLAFWFYNQVKTEELKPLVEGEKKVFKDKEKV